ncbi:uncharacterized protein LOC141899511 [Tubulanus polymorphus]|uniref:uncharacterized protein LOC141899511 n=1 Tax=Tubulanus polymorphus TaxID=672921 RepID=UPI003DA5EE23
MTGTKNNNQNTMVDIQLGEISRDGKISRPNAQENGTHCAINQTPDISVQSTESSDHIDLAVPIVYKQIMEKLVYLISVITLIVLAYGVSAKQWIVPYYYAIATPFLLSIRIIMYVKWKWHFFLIDFCYFCNTFLFIFIWACPYHADVFSVVFGMANGPLISAVVIFRNSLVFHDIDKLISTYIHILPPFLTFCIRWYPEITSAFWYDSFVPKFGEPSFLWLVAVPLACFVSHGIIYFIVVRLIIKPNEEYLDSFQFLSSKENTWTSKLLNCAGPKGKIWLFLMYNWLMGLFTTLLTRLWYEYFIAHCCLLSVAVIVVTWNGGTFYLDVFSRRDSKKSNKVIDL